MIKTLPSEFEKFHKSLMSNSPKDYIPWYFPVLKDNKAPDGIAISYRAPKNILEKRGNWKAEWARLTYEEALQRLKNGHNVGISAREYDPLVIIDIDYYDYIKYMPETLTSISRKRSGLHGFCWKKQSCKKLPLNIPTDYGEVRSSDQYVVAPGSYCITSPTHIEKESISKSIKEIVIKDKYLGNYTIRDNISPLFIEYDDLPFFFKEKRKKIVIESKFKNVSIKKNSKHSALYDLEISDIVTTIPGRREPHPLHDSDTGMNFSISGNIAHCWRHLVSLNAIQFLVVKSGYMSCLEAGTAHKNSEAGASKIINNEEAIFHAWIQAKKDGFISQDDPIPSKALIYIAKKHRLIGKNNKDVILKKKKYDNALKIIKYMY